MVDAVRCAIEVQNGLIERNAGLPPERRIEFRVGIHLGDVVEEADGDLMGDGVNIEARLESICEPGGVCLSSAAYEQVRDKLKYEFVDIGEKHLKNIARPVRAYAVTPAAIVAAAKSGAAVPSPAPKGRGVSARSGAILAGLVVAVLAAGAYAWHAGFAPRRSSSRAATPLAAGDEVSAVSGQAANFELARSNFGGFAPEIVLVCRRPEGHA